jgi:DNA helicase-2/ATP-dependent DNA helicase PcrA
VSAPIPEVVFGSPGCGKTTTLLGVVEEELVRGVPPDQIGFVSFTRRAADEAASRAAAKFGFSRDEMVNFRTIHSLCFRHLGLRKGDVVGNDQIREFADHAGIRVTGRFSEDGTLTGMAAGDRALFIEHKSRIRGVSVEQQYREDAETLPWREVDRVARAYAEWKEARGLIDFSDMLMDFAAGGSRPRLRSLIVDEAQDLSKLQWRVVARLSEGCERTNVGGDDDQCIFKWAGADGDHMIDMEGSAKILGRSWRVPRSVQRLATTIVERIGRRRAKEWSPRDEEGTIIRVGDLDACDTSDQWNPDAPQEQPILILARNGYLLDEQVEPMLRRRGVVYERDGRRSVRASLLSAIVAWEDLRAGRVVSAARAREAYEFMTVGRGVVRGYKKLPGLGEDQEVTIEGLERVGGLLTRAVWHEALDRIPPAETAYVLAARRSGERLTTAAPRVRISTIHGAKGAEARHVILLTEQARRTHREAEIRPDDEHRVMYVGVTRAREKLTIVGSTTPQFYRM